VSLRIALLRQRLFAANHCVSSANGGSLEAALSGVCPHDNEMIRLALDTLIIQLLIWYRIILHLLTVLLASICARYASQ
jgi:hypothetical protein